MLYVDYIIACLFTLLKRHWQWKVASNSPQGDHKKQLIIKVRNYLISYRQAKWNGEPLYSTSEEISACSVVFREMRAVSVDFGRNTRFGRYGFVADKVELWIFWRIWTYQNQSTIPLLKNTVVFCFIWWVVVE